MFHAHNWKVKSAMNGQEDYTAGGKRPVTLVLYRCEKCGTFKDEVMKNGNWAQELTKVGEE